MFKLKRCPYCGSETVDVYVGRDSISSEVRCAKCGVRTLEYPSPEAAVQVWNRRSREAATEELVNWAITGGCRDE